MRVLLLPSLLACLLLPGSSLADEEPDVLVEQATRALNANQPEKALPLLDRALKAAPKSTRTWFLRAAAHDMLGEPRKALDDLNELLRLDPNAARAINERGGIHFKLGNLKESVADFDHYLKMRPDGFNEHWRRGISLYYARRFDDGRKQFEGYEKVSTTDVENAVWHFLCVAGKDGVDKARASLLKIGRDRRVPMMQVYDLFAGKLKPADVLKAVEEGKPDEAERNTRLFYAHLYLGLYAEVSGDSKAALEHMETAVKHRVRHYMWDVARVHRDLLKKK
jgi:lipoprotein NlpI